MILASCRSKLLAGKEAIDAALTRLDTIENLMRNTGIWSALGKEMDIDSGDAIDLLARIKQVMQYGAEE